MIKTKLLVPAVALFALAGCQTNGDMYRSDVYGSNQVNQAQQVQTVEIIAIQPARVAVNNQSDRNVSQMVGTALGGILGAVIGNQVTHHRDSGTAIGAIAGAAAMAVFSVPSNYFITYPAYVQFYHMPLEAILGMYQAILPSADSLIKCLVIFNMPFTLVKGLLDAVLCLLIYKPLSPILHGRK